MGVAVVLTGRDHTPRPSRSCNIGTAIAKAGRRLPEAIRVLDAQPHDGTARVDRHALAQAERSVSPPPIASVTATSRPGNDVTYSEPQGKPV